MDKITISSTDGTVAVTLPKVKDIQVGAEEVANTVTMASGKVVKDMIGYRSIIKASWDYIPADTVLALTTLLRSGGFFHVEYPAPNGNSKGIFEIEYPSMSIFAFRNGVAVWHNVKLNMTAQEVQR